MSPDYIILAIIAVLGIGGGLYLRYQARLLNARRHINDKQQPHQPAH